MIAGALVLAERIVQGYLAIKSNTTPPRTGLFSSLKLTWLLPTSLGAIIGLLGGLFIRANDALACPRNFREELHDKGFTVDQVNAIMDRATLKEGIPVLQASDGSYLLSSGSSGATRQIDVQCEAARRVAIQRGQSDEVILNDLESSGSDALKKEIRTIRNGNNQMSPAEILQKLLKP